MEGNVQPRADQPLVTQKDLQRGEQPANLEYRIQGVRNYTNNNTRNVRNYSRRV
jgi:hypothetical protein